MVYFVICTQFSFLGSKKVSFNTKKWIYLFAVFIFTGNEYNGIFVKKFKVCVEFLIEKWKVKKKRVNKKICAKHKMITRFEKENWVQKMKSENEYTPNTN